MTTTWSAKDKFLSLVIKYTNGCWSLSNSTIGNWYQKFTFKGIRYPAHTFAFANFKGSILSGQEVHHTCENKWCCNPEHLEVHYKKDHIALTMTNIMTQKAIRTHCPNGHEFKKENIYLQKDGSRKCKQCVKDYNKQNGKKRATSKPISDQALAAYKAKIAGIINGFSTPQN